jgi:hypothetical protein
LGATNRAGRGHRILTKRPVHTLTGLKRIKIASFGPNLKLLEKMGVKAVPLPLAERCISSSGSGIRDTAPEVGREASVSGYLKR